MSNTRIRVERLLDEGLTGGEIARRLGITVATVSYHRRRLGQPGDGAAARRYDWAEIQAHHDAGNSVRECQERFGFSRQTWHAAVARGAVLPRPPAMAVELLLAAGVARSRGHVKRRLLRLGLKENRCEVCGISEWLGAPLSLALHHVNGDGRGQPAREPAAAVPELPWPNGQLCGQKHPKKAGQASVTLPSAGCRANLG